MATEQPKIIETTNEKWHEEAYDMIEQGYFLAHKDRKLYWVYKDLIDDDGNIQWNS